MNNLPTASTASTDVPKPVRPYVRKRPPTHHAYQTSPVVIPFSESVLSGPALPLGGRGAPAKVQVVKERLQVMASSPPPTAPGGPPGAAGSTTYVLKHPPNPRPKMPTIIMHKVGPGVTKEEATEALRVQKRKLAGAMNQQDDKEERRRDTGKKYKRH